MKNVQQPIIELSAIDVTSLANWIVGAQPESHRKRKMSLSDIKIFTLNFSSLAISMTDIDVVLKLSLLVISIGYTLHKWYLLNKNNK